MPYTILGGDRDTLLMLYRAIVRSKLHFGCVVYGTASNTNLRQLDSIHNTGLRLALGALCTSPVSSLYAETNEAPLEERRLKLSMNYYLKTIIVDRRWPLTTCSWNVQLCRKFGMNTTLLTLWRPSLRRFPRLAWWNFYEKLDSSIWYELSKIINCKWPYLCRTTNMFCRTCVVVKQIQSNPIHQFE